MQTENLRFSLVVSHTHPRSTRKVFAICGFTQENEFHCWVSFSPSGSALDTSLDSRGHTFVPSSDIGSIRWHRLGLRTSDIKSNFAVLDYNSQLLEVSTFQSSDSESTQNIWHLMKLMVFCVSSESSVKAIGLQDENLKPQCKPAYGGPQGPPDIHTLSTQTLRRFISSPSKGTFINHAPIA